MGAGGDSTVIGKVKSLIEILVCGLIRCAATGERRHKVVVIGSIGAGKTTFIGKLIKSLPAYTLVEEPVQEMRNMEGRNLLEELYAGELHGRVLNMLALQYYTDKERGTSGQILMDRDSIQTGIFAVNMFMGGHMPYIECLMFIKMIAASQMLPTRAILYLNTSAETCKKRIAVRARAEEKPIKDSLLKNLEYVHTMFTDRVKMIDENLVLVFDNGAADIAGMDSFVEECAQNLTE